MNRIVYFVAPLHILVHHEYGGVHSEILAKKKIWEDNGYQVIFYSPYSRIERNAIVYLFMANRGTVDFVQSLDLRCKLYVSPIIDSLYPNVVISVFARLPRLLSFTSHFSFLRTILIRADVIEARSIHELKRISCIIGENSKTIVVKNTTLTNITPIETERDIDLLFVGDWRTSRKNFSRLLKSIKTERLTFACVGPEKERLQNKLKRELSKNVHIKVFSNVTNGELHSLYSRSKVFVLPSLYEGTGLSALEAMNSGCKIVITSKGGTLDYFQGRAKFVNPYCRFSILNGIKIALKEANE